MELRELAYFTAVCELKNFTAAAEKLHVSQPAVSKAITKLEAELGLSLLDRTQKRVLITEEGKIFLGLAQGFLAHLQSIETTMIEYKKLTRGTFRIAVPPLLGAYVFPPLFAAFKKRYPDLEMMVLEDGSAKAAQLVREKNAHAGLVILPPDLSILALNSHIITSQEIVACLPPTHPLITASVLSFDQIKKEPLILYNEGYILREIILKEYAKKNHSPNIVISTNQFQTIKALVAKEVGLSFLPVNCLEKDDAMITRSLFPRLFLNMGLIWLPDQPLPLAGKAFIDFTINYTYHP